MKLRNGKYISIRNKQKYVAKKNTAKKAYEVIPDALLKIIAEYHHCSECYINDNKKYIAYCDICDTNSEFKIFRICKNCDKTPDFLNNKNHYMNCHVCNEPLVKLLYCEQIDPKSYNFSLYKNYSYTLSHCKCGIETRILKTFYSNIQTENNDEDDEHDEDMPELV